jgi:hypothetical protein
MPVYVIYKIQCGDEIYIGSTKNFLKRKSAHKAAACDERNRAHGLKIYQAIRANGGWNPADIAPIEQYECENGIQAKMREEYWLREYKPTLNVRRAYVPDEEKNELKLQASNKWRENNREKYNEYQRLLMAKRALAKKTSASIITNENTTLDAQGQEVDGDIQ